MASSGSPLILRSTIPVAPLPDSHEIRTNATPAPEGVGSLATYTASLGSVTFDAKPAFGSRTYQQLTDKHGPPIGSIGDCLLFKQLGAGGMGVVWLGYEQSADRAVAVKELSPMTHSELARSRFGIEAISLARVNHVNVVTILSAGYCNDRNAPFFLMRLVDGHSLQTELDMQTSGKPLFNLAQGMAGLAEGVHAAHREGVLHRDLKPGNIIVADRADGKVHLVAIDFGLAKYPGSQNEDFSFWKNGVTPSRDPDAFSNARSVNPALTRADVSVGTPLYMSPEACTDPAKVDARSDVYALGAVTYELLAGRPPFTGRTAHEVMRGHVHGRLVKLAKDEVPKEVSNVVHKALEKNPEKRFQTAAEYSDALAQGMKLSSTWNRSLSD